MGLFNRAVSGADDIKTRFAKAAVLVLSSRVVVGASAALTLAFACQLLYARNRLPPLGGLSLIQLGLPPLNLGDAGQTLRDAADAAQRQGATAAATDFLATHPALIPYVNLAGFFVFAALLAWTFALQIQAYRQRAQ